MPVTRSGHATAGPSSEMKASSGKGATRKTRLKAKQASSPCTELSSYEESDNNVRPDDVERHLRHALSGVIDLRKQVNDLEAKNRLLQEQLDSLKDAEEAKTQPRRGRKGGMSNHMMLMKIRMLSSENTKLERARAKDKRKIRKLLRKEIERDADDLQDGETHDVEDIADQMRKLLRRYYTVVTSPSLAEDEECNVCLEKLKIDTAISLPCQHVFCKGCLQQNAQAQMHDLPKCPTCRQPYEPDLSGTEQVHRTATQQWDELLELARSWASIDVEGGEDEPEDTEEEEASFINDEELRTSTTALSDAEGSESREDRDLPIPFRARPSRLQTPPDPAVNEMRADGEIHTDEIPENGSQVLGYQESPTSEKRKRLEELAASRRKRRL